MTNITITLMHSKVTQTGVSTLSLHYIACFLYYKLAVLF